MNYIKVIFFSHLLIFLSACQPQVITNDPSGAVKIARKAEQYLIGCPDFFIPPVEGTDGTLQNKTGAVAWCPTMIVGNPPNTENKSSYITRLNLAKEQEQTNWSQYKKIYGSPSSGYPGYYYYDNQQQLVLVPERIYQAGFICYSLVYNSIIDAGYSPFNQIPLSVNDLLNRLVGPFTTTDDRYEGDIIAYNWDLDEIYDHVGILVDKSSATANDWKVVSSIGIIEIFKYGAQKRRAHVFGSTNGGEFQFWPTQYENYSTVYFYVNPNSLQGGKNAK